MVPLTDDVDYDAGERFRNGPQHVQEIHTLKQKLILATQMESEYLDEIEQLKSSLDSLRKQSEANKDCVRNNEIGSGDDTLSCEMQKKIGELEEVNATLVIKLRIERDMRTELEEKLDALNDAKSKQPSEESRINAIEIESLNFQLEELKEAHANEIACLTKRLKDVLDDLDEARLQIAEINAQSNSLRGELAETKAQLEGLEMQAYSIEGKRGNSLFSEVTFWWICFECNQCF
ncbi:unnamed protein product [Protopolystoma xenopodis]|uniref:Uncharacterized protein n=1 Tax=Protopolystoma xenopodis TaxID=117903 RepID=A0A448XER0_9PLAT|nr:unnamed protein product [Protopolystoma xenopodis]